MSNETTFQSSFKMPEWKEYDEWVAELTAELEKQEEIVNDIDKLVQDLLTWK